MYEQWMEEHSVPALHVQMDPLHGLRVVVLDAVIGHVHTTLWKYTECCYQCFHIQPWGTIQKILV